MNQINIQITTESDNTTFSFANYDPTSQRIIEDINKEIWSYLSEKNVNYTQIAEQETYIANANLNKETLDNIISKVQKLLQNRSITLLVTINQTTYDPTQNDIDLPNNHVGLNTFKLTSQRRNTTSHIIAPSFLNTTRDNINGLLNTKQETTIEANDENAKIFPDNASTKYINLTFSKFVNNDFGVYSIRQNNSTKVSDIYNKNGAPALTSSINDNRRLTFHITDPKLSTVLQQAMPNCTFTIKSCNSMEMLDAIIGSVTDKQKIKLNTDDPWIKENIAEISKKLPIYKSHQAIKPN